ncbi:MAG: DUF5906 domain-containing protein [Planctomycetota bacterium]
MIPDELPPALAAFAAYPQFIVWKFVPQPEGVKDKKVPIDPGTGAACNPHDASNQFTFNDARDNARSLGLNVGFAFNAVDPFFFVDVDNALRDGQWSDVAQWVFASFPGAAFEVSASGKGFHLFGRYEGAFPEHGKRRDDIGLEFYDTVRFVAFTFDSMQGDGNLPFNGYVEQFTAAAFPPKPTAELGEWVEAGPVPAARPITDDSKLIARMCAPTLRLGNKAQFADFWSADVDRLAAAFPRQSEEKEFDGQSADLSMASILAFWTGKDLARIERLMRASGFYALRAWKWDPRPDYLQKTILMACASCTGVYGAESAPTAAEAAPRVAAPTVGYALIAADRFPEFFSGCTYVIGRNRVLMPNGEFLGSEAFRAHMGGRKFAMEMDCSDDTDNAYKAFTESRAWPTARPQVWSTTFKPQDPPGSRYNARGEIDLTGTGAVNTYVTPLDVVSTPGDVTPFLDLLSRQLPDARDFQILLSWMAAIIQYPGCKFQWAPVMQGVPGNGKTFLAVMLARAVGAQYVHTPNSGDLDNKFNAWIESKILIIADDGDMKKQGIIERLTPMITNPRIEIQGKGGNQYTGENCANFIFIMNDKDMIRKTRDDRRFAIFHTAQQSTDDLIRDGMDAAYFVQLDRWFKAGGFAHITHYLQNYQIAEEFNPTTLAQRAPMTSSTQSAIEESRNTLEQTIQEAIEQGARGFMGGWVSSKWLSLRLERHKRSGPRANAKALKAVGYVPHPSLHGGRSPVAIACDEGTKSRLYVKADSIQSNIDGPQVVEAYIRAQNATAPATGSALHGS